ncbi:tautomerase family protein [Rivularia sp. UHCC 0363]|uniref:tautomerase family protein n=1 Tax=Rivularia sp. UHCC 0363 TaxID=3110244 RepID=UPI002B1F1C4F|nr:tautomerase family protein [Rivularia sp. UHCC 0363]MEA5595169.1 tautomerase family protein [Rivularia sp. UHCC 0363]
MPQTKIYGVSEYLNPIKNQLSMVIHSCFVDVLQYPPEKRFHRFFPMDKSDFIFPSDKSQSYIIIEISMFEGRSIEVKKNLILLLIKRIGERFRISNNDIEITIFETPRHNWGLRGVPGDELDLAYKVDL